MAAEYQLRIIDTAGATQAIITDYLQLAFARVVNEPGLLSFILSDQNLSITYAVINNQVEVWRRNQDIALDWTREFIGIIRSLTWSTDEVTTVTVNAPGVMSMLGWNIVAFRSGISNRSYFQDVTGDRVMSRIVQYNCTSATDTSRIRSATSSGKISGLYTINIEAVSGLGNTISYYCAYDNVLAALQNVQPITGGDFDLVKTAATTFEFRWYLGQLGTNKTATLFFALDRGNMANPVFVDDCANERTVSIVAGRGEELNRYVITRTSTNYSAASRAFETYSNASNASSVYEMRGIGDGDLFEKRATRSFSFDALQAPNAYYGVHYSLGDLVTGIYRGESFSQKINSVAIQFDANGGESIKVGMISYTS